METRNTIVEQLGIFRGKIVHIMANVSGRTEPQAEMVLLLILGYIVIVLLLLFIHRRTLRKYKRIHENLVFLYDSIRYQVAKVQYSNPAIQDTKGVKVVFESEHENYGTNAKKIKEEILLIEQKLGQKIVSDNQRKTIARQTARKSSAKAFVNIIGRCTTLITAGVYRLFW